MRNKNLKKIDQKKGILFWVTGLAGSGKTSISKILRNKIEKRYGPTVVLSGDDIRNIFNLKSYDYSSRLEIGKKYCKLAKKLTDQNINVIFAVIGMFNFTASFIAKDSSFKILACFGLPVLYNSPISFANCLPFDKNSSVFF